MCPITNISKNNNPTAKKDPQDTWDKTKSLKIISNAEFIQMGTLMYYKEKKNSKQVSKSFVPIFPFLYDDVKNGRLINSAEFYLPKPL